MPHNPRWRFEIRKMVQHNLRICSYRTGVFYQNDNASAIYFLPSNIENNKIYDDTNKKKRRKTDESNVRLL